MTGDTDLHRRPQQRPRLTRIAIPLPQMHAIRPQPLCKGGAVIDDEGAVVIGTEPLQRLGRTRDGMIVQPLETELKCRHGAAIERRLQRLRKRSIEHWRRNQIELARRAAIVPFETLREMRIQRHFLIGKVCHAAC